MTAFMFRVLAGYALSYFVTVNGDIRRRFDAELHLLADDAKNFHGDPERR
jgi:hypothetical protein